MHKKVEEMSTEELTKLQKTLKEQLVAGPPLPLDQRVETLEKQIQDIRNQIEVLSGKLEVLTGLPQKTQLQTSPSSISASAESKPSQTIGGIKGSSEEELKKLETTVRTVLKEAEWDTEYINNLPDSAFAVISKGGEKDEQNKTVPRTLRHLPHHNAQGDLDLPHLRNALARLPQTDLSPEERAEAKRHLCAHAKESQIVSEVCGEESPKVSEGEEVVSLRRKIVDLEAKLAESEKARTQQANALQKKYRDFRRMVESAIPLPHIWKAWRPGCQMMVQQLQKVLRESSESWSQNVTASTEDELRKVKKG